MIGRAASRSNLGKHMGSKHSQHTNMVGVKWQVQDEEEVQEEE